MKKTPNFKAMFEEIERERGIKEEDLIAALKDALLSAAKKRFENPDVLEVQISPDGAAKIFDKEKGVEVTPSDFGRLAAQTAKQVIIQRLREAEKEGNFEEFSHKVGELVTGTIQQRETFGYLINLGRVETFLPIQESIPGDILKPKEKVKVLVLEVKKTSKGPLISISRSHPDFIRRLFENEIAEIKQGILEIKNIVREAGRRTKIALITHDPNVGVVGTCVGPMGSRIQNITKEVGAERIDIIEWSEKPEEFISNALAPAKSIKVKINEEEKSARVILPERELSLAIGKDGHNVRLASRLTGYKIDITSEEKIKSGEAKSK
jgi:N utilization substance protein A